MCRRLRLNTPLERSVIKRAEVAQHPAENIDLSARRVKPVFVRELHLSVLLRLHLEPILFRRHGRRGVRGDYPALHRKDGGNVLKKLWPHS